VGLTVADAVLLEAVRTGAPPVELEPLELLDPLELLEPLELLAPSEVLEPAYSGEVDRLFCLNMTGDSAVSAL